MTSRRSSTRVVSSSSSTAPVMKICSLAARNVSISASSRQVSQPIRRPGSPYVFDIDETPTTRGDRLAALGKGVSYARGR